MDRPLIYPGAIPLETDLLNASKSAYIGLSKLAAAMFGTGTFVNGLVCSQSAVPNMQVSVGAGEIYSLQNIDGTAYSSLAADTAHQILKQGVLLDAVALNCPAPLTAGQSINYLVQAAFSEVDAASAVLPYYNASNPSVAWSGAGNSGVAQATNRSNTVSVSVVAGTAATTGSQTTPAPSGGAVGLWVVTVAFGAASITNANISQYASAPFNAMGGAISRAVAATLNKSVAGGANVTLDPVGEASAAIINLTGALTAGISVIVPASADKWIVSNNTSGAFALTFKTAAGTGIVVPQGGAMVLYCDGTNVLSAASYAAKGANSDITSLNVLASINGGQISGFRNKIINGDMQVSQVNGATAVTPATASSYPIDQWQLSQSQSSKLTVQQVADAPAGFKFSAKITVAVQYVPLATDTFTIQQPIEGQNITDFQLGTAGAVTIATGQYIKGSIAGNYAVSIRNGANNRSYVGLVAVTTTWAKLNIVLVGDTSGIWATDNTVGLIYSFDLGSGTNFNAAAANTWQAGAAVRTLSAVTFVNQVAGSTLNITGVQLEQVSAGATQGTSFEHVGYADQLRWCQRYLPCWSGAGFTFPAYANIPTSANGIVMFPVPTRAPVSGMISSAAATFMYGMNTGFTGSAISGSNYSSTSAIVTLTIAGAVAGQGGYLQSNSGASLLYFTGAQM